ncbi:DUF4041 domain-containing protein [Plantactinospora sp. WMMB334]|uniref:DUF4041 domain-containing protein n=1 Tax=Plantactinospora sp. WMMB334 TaxID=3404119 RepID=UPI003B92976B
MAGAAAPGTAAPPPPVPPTAVPAPRPSKDVDIPLFGARGKARELAGQAAQLQTELERCRAEMDRLGVLSAVELERYRDELRQQIAEANARAEARKADLRHQEAAVSKHLQELRQQVVVTEETILLQEAGVYQYRHPLHDAVAYQAQLAALQGRIKVMARKDGGAVLGATNWTVNDSAAEGRRMVRDFSTLMLRAYNAEADNLVRGLKPYKLDAAIERLSKVAHTIARLGRTMQIRISEEYHRLRISELELTADYVAKVAEEKEREREEKARLREERRVQQEMERERARLDKERQHYANVLATLHAQGNAEEAAKAQERLEQIDRSIEDVDYRAANARAGYVYVISNLGAFGDRVVKIGMTRRLDPLDRVRELGDASVPFGFDVHALFFSEDAVGIESQMHHRLAARRVNRVNQRREFFYATPAEVRGHLMELAGNLLHFEEVPEALEYRQSLSEAEPAAVS